MMGRAVSASAAGFSLFPAAVAKGKKVVLLFKDALERGRFAQPTLLPARPQYP